MKPTDPLGSRPRVTIRRVVRTTYRLEWEFDRMPVVTEVDTTRTVKVKSFFSRPAAYRAAALRLIFARRDRYNDGEAGCRLCRETPHGPEDPGQCRYHGGEGWDDLVARLTSWLMWRDGVADRGLAVARQLTRRALRLGFV